MHEQLSNPGAAPFLFVLALSLLSALFIGYLYVHFHADRATGSQVYRAFPLLGLSITAIFITVQFSLPLSLGLLGALSLVRFRVPVKEPEEIGFVMLVIAASLAVAAYKIALLGIILAVGLGAVTMQSLMRRYLRPARGAGRAARSRTSVDFQDRSGAVYEGPGATDYPRM